MPAVQSALDAGACEGAERVLSECLSLEDGNVVTVFHDETTAGCDHAFEAAARKLALEYRAIHVPLDRQIELRDHLEPEYRNAIDVSRAVILCLSDSVAATPFRRRLVEHAVDQDRYVGTMPGATVSVLAYAVNIDYEETQRKCEEMALVLLAGREVELVTYDFDAAGEPVAEHTLFLNLGGPDRCPVTSTGKIPRGTWGNLPAGETFIAPMEGSARGSFALNGAFTGHVLAPGESLVLEFSGGTLDNIRGHAETRERFKAMLAEWWHQRHLGLAELGIGVNPSITKLTGCALFDEKMAGTIHIAVGDNHTFGGRLKSPIHEDVITLRPTLRVNGREVMRNGQVCLDLNDWRESERHLTALSDSDGDWPLVARTQVDGEIDRQGRLRVRRHVGAKRVCVYQVGDDALSARLAPLYRQLPDEAIKLARLRAQTILAGLPFTETELRGALAILHRHGLVGLLPDHD